MNKDNTLKHPPGSYAEILDIAIPLVVSTGSWTIMHFTDRLFLSRYSQDAFASALPAGVLSFTFACFFIGTAGYTGTFVAQYYGAKQFSNIGKIVWQGVFFAMFSGLILLSLIPLADDIFSFIGHPEPLPALETTYFRILCYGMTFAILTAVFSGFFSGMGKTKIVMIVNVACSGFNIILDYAWIFGKFGLPRWGLRGAAWATVFATILGSLVFFVLFMLPGNRKKFNTLGGFRIDLHLIKRLMKYGMPNGVNFFLDISAFSLFVIMVGRLGKAELTATNISFNINVLAFMPMIGFAIATNILVGQYIGRNLPETAEKCVRRVFLLTVGYMGVVALSYVLVPSLYVNLYGTQGGTEITPEIRNLARTLLIFVAIYSFFDAVNLVFSSAIRGAGDTPFVMRVVVVCSLSIVLIPTYVCCVVLKGSIFIAWTFFSLYIVVMAIIFYLRYRGGKWKSMKVIETTPPEIAPAPGALGESEVMR